MVGRHPSNRDLARRPPPQCNQKIAGALRSLRRVLRQKPTDDRSCIFGQLVEVRGRANVFDDDFLVAGPFERDRAGEEFVADDAQAVEIGASVLGAFGRQVCGRAQERTRSA